MPPSRPTRPAARPPITVHFRSSPFTLICRETTLICCINSLLGLLETLFFSLKGIQLVSL
jgi:hypothetical protein